MVWGGTAPSRARQGRGIGEGEKEGKEYCCSNSKEITPIRQISPLWDHTLPLDFSRTLGIDSQIPWIQFRHAKGWVPPAPSPAEEAACARSGAAPPLPGFKPCLLHEKNPPLSSPSNTLGWKLRLLYVYFTSNLWKDGVRSSPLRSQPAELAFHLRCLWASPQRLLGSLPL